MKFPIVRLPDLPVLKTVPGVGEVLSTIIMLETGPIDRFHSPGNYASYARCVGSTGKTVLLAVIAFSCLRIGSWLLYSGQTEAPGSLTIDFVLAACISPGLTAIAIAGAARAKYLHWTAERSAKQ